MLFVHTGAIVRVSSVTAVPEPWEDLTLSETTVLSTDDV